MSYDHPKFKRIKDGLFLNFCQYGGEIEVAAFSLDGSRVLTVHKVGVARVWDVATGSLVGEIRPTSPLEGSRAAPMGDRFVVFVEAAALDASGELALLGLNDGTAGVFAVADGRRLSTLHRPDTKPGTEWELIRAVSFSPDGSLAVVGFYSRTVGVWDREGRTLRAMLRPERGDRLVTAHSWSRETLVSSVAVSHDNRYVFAGSMDMSATVWDLDSGEIVFDAWEHVETILDFVETDRGMRWATSGGTVWEASDSGGARRRLTTGENWEEVALAEQGDVLLARTARGEVRRWTLSGESDSLSKFDPMLFSPKRSVAFVDEGRVERFPRQANVAESTSTRATDRAGGSHRSDSHASRTAS